MIKMTAKEIAQAVDGILTGNGDTVITDIQYDSRAVKNGTLFAAARKLTVIILSKTVLQKVQRQFSQRMVFRRIQQAVISKLKILVWHCRSLRHITEVSRM